MSPEKGSWCVKVGAGRKGEGPDPAEPGALSQDLACA